MSEEREVSATEAGKAGCNMLIIIGLMLLILMSLGPLAAVTQLSELAEQNRIEMQQRGEGR